MDEVKVILADDAPSNQTGDTNDVNTKWVEALSNQKAEEKAVMLEMRNAEENKRKKSSRMRKLLYFLLLCCAVAIIVLAIKLSKATGNTTGESEDQVTGTKSQGSDKPQSADKDVCTSKECILASAQIFESIDSSRDPCDSFYDYACGRWMSSHTIPPDRSNLATYSLLRDEVVVKIKGLLEENTTTNELDVFKNVKHLYQSCVNEDLIEQRNLSVVYPLLKEFGGWPLLGDGPGGEWNESEFDLVRLLVSILKYSNYPLISSWAGMDDKNNTQNILFIDQPSLGMPERNYYLDPKLHEKFMAYKTLIRNMALMFGASESTIDTDVEDILSLETDIANITVRSEDRRDSNSMYNKMTVREMQDNYTKIKDCEKIQFSWLKYIQGAMDVNGLDVNITEDEEVVLVSIPYYEQLWNVLVNYSPRTISNYALWRILRNRQWNLPSRFGDEYQKYKKALYGTPTKNARWKTCSWFARNKAEMVVGRLYVERYVDDNAKPEMEGMIKNIRQAFKTQVNQLDWMDDTMKEFAIEKADNIVEAVAYPDSIKNDTYLEKTHPIPSMDPTKHFENVLKFLRKNSKFYYEYIRKTNDNTDRVKWVTSPTTVNAFYSPQRNQISFPAGIMTPPYFDSRRPRAMNYGALGFLVGHEISHGFDDNGRQFDKIGNLFNWWTPEAEQKFNKKKECLLEQYGNFFWEAAGMKVNPLNTIGENIADNGGIKQAYKGYQKWLEQNGGLDLKPPGVDLTRDQLFFVGFAQVTHQWIRLSETNPLMYHMTVFESRCGISRHDSAVNHILTGAHSPLRFRVDGSLQNMEEFAKAFKCPLNSTMNPVKRCAVW